MELDVVRFGESWAFGLLALVVALGGLGVWHESRHAQLVAKLGDQRVVARLVASLARGRRVARLVVWTVAMLLVVAAAARPRYGLRESDVSNSGIDTVIVVDASKSMLVRDVVPNRLKGAVTEVGALLDRMAGGRVALVPFAGIAYVQCPLTTDHDVIKTYLGELKPQDVPIGGTNIGRALMVAMDVLTGDSERKAAEARGNAVDQFAGSNHRAIILMTDGEDHEGAAIDAAKKAADKGIRIFTVGIGSSFGDPVPILGADGSVTGTLKDPQGNPIFSLLNETLLQQIADTTGGKYFHYANTTVVPDLHREVDALEKREYATKYMRLGEDRFQYPLALALLLLLIETFLSERRKLSSLRVASSGAAIVLVFGALSLPAVARASSIFERENPDVRAGRDNLTTGKPGEAKQSFETARASNPESAFLWFNLGLANAALKDFDAAREAFERALQVLPAREPAFEADVHFAAGTSQLGWSRALAEQRDDKGAAEHAKLAVESLEKALVLAPDRADIKRNLEVALLVAEPPCRARDRTMEPNDQIEQAAQLKIDPATHESQAELLMCPEDRDLFRLDVQPGDRVSAEIVFKVEGEPPAKLGLALLAADGTTRLRPPAESQEVVSKVALREITAAGSYFLDVRNVAEVESAYTLKAKVLPECRRIEDRFEPNDMRAQARDLPVGQPQTLRLCPRNDDYFSVSLQAGQGLELKAKPRFEMGAETFELRIEAPDGRVVARGRQVKEGFAARLASAPSEGLYVIHVLGGLDTEADYQLAAAVLPPCRERDDKYEPNDSADTAKDLTTDLVNGPIQPLHLCPSNDDFFAVKLKDGESLLVDLSAQVEDLPDAQDLAGALTLTVLDASGAVKALATGGAVTSGQQVNRTTAVLSPPPGVYRLRVTGGDALELPYALNLRILPPCPEGNDEQEPNDKAADAKPLELNKELLVRICKGDEDWFSVKQAVAQHLVASARYDATHGAIAMSVTDEGGSTVLSEGKTPPVGKGLTATVAVDIPESKTERSVRVRVRGATPDAENFYILRLTEPPPPSDNKDKNEQKKDDQKKDDKKDQDKKDKDKQDQGKKDDKQQPKEPPKPQQQEALHDEMKRADKNPKNLEAQEALRRMGGRRAAPTKDW